MTSTEMAINAKRIDFTSKVNGKDYRLLISEPAGEPPAAGWPVVYLIDGSLHFGITVDTMRIQACWPETQDAVIVGIAYQTDSVQTALAVRNHDLTPPISQEILDGSWMKDMPVGVEGYGGQAAYLRMIEEEARPLAAQHARINQGDQTLIGHSLGGLTSLTVLFSNPGMFQRYVAISPSIWYANRWVLGLVDAFEEQVRSGGVNAQLFLSTGEFEEIDPLYPPFPKSKMLMPEDVFKAMMADCAMVTLPAQLTERLKPLCGTRFDMKFVVHKGDDHRSVVPAGIAGGIYYTQYRPE
jgi:predicted alpha/beta superfamily hydrolase